MKIKNAKYNLWKVLESSRKLLNYNVHFFICSPDKANINSLPPKFVYFFSFWHKITPLKSIKYIGWQLFLTDMMVKSVSKSETWILYPAKGCFKKHKKRTTFLFNWSFSRHSDSKSLVSENFSKRKYFTHWNKNPFPYQVILKWTKMEKLYLLENCHILTKFLLASNL